MSLPLPVPSLIDDCNVGPLVLERTGPKVYNSRTGDYTAAAAALVRVNPVSAHTADGNELLEVPESDREREVVKFYTKVRVYVAEGDQSADVWRYQGRRFRVVRVKDYALQGGCYISWGARMEEQ